jgi:hypothetical protein
MAGKEMGLGSEVFGRDQESSESEKRLPMNKR